MQETGNNSISIFKKVLDESFKHGDPAQLDIYLYSDPDTTQVAARDTDSHKFIGTEVFTNGEDYDSFETLRSLLSSSELLSDPPDHTHVISGYREATLVPNPLFDHSSADKLFGFSVPSDGSTHIHTDELRITGARNLYTVPQEFSKLAEELNGDLIHTSTVLIESQLSVNRNTEEVIVTAMIHRSFFNIIITQGRKLLFYNSFDIENDDSVVYFLLFTCEQLELNPDSVKVQLGGMVSENSGSFNEAFKYFRNIGFCPKPEHSGYSYIYDDIPDHQLYHLFCIPACV